MGLAVPGGAAVDTVWRHSGAAMRVVGIAMASAFAEALRVQPEAVREWAARDGRHAAVRIDSAHFTLQPGDYIQDNIQEFFLQRLAQGSADMTALDDLMVEGATRRRAPAPVGRQGLCWGVQGICRDVQGLRRGA